MELKKVKFPRCLSPLIGDALERQLHEFCDASKDGFCAVAYLKCSKTTEDVTIRLICAKTRVSPKKPLTIPKLELQAAVLASRLAGHLNRTLRLKINRRIFWTDSRVVRCWISSVAQTFKPFVAVRVGKIQSLTLAREWRHIPGKLNPANLGTRSSQTSAINNVWINGPGFLLNTRGEWPPDIEIDNTTEEQRQRYSINEEKAEVHSSRVGDEANTVQDIIKASRQGPGTDHFVLQKLLHQAQRESFQDDFNDNNAFCPGKKSRLLKLSPYIVECWMWEKILNLWPSV